MKFTSSVFFLMNYTLSVTQKNLLPIPSQKIIFSSRSCRLYIWVIFVYGMRYRSNWFFFFVSIQLFYTIYENPFLHWLSFALLLKINCTYVCGCFYGLRQWVLCIYLSIFEVAMTLLGCLSTLSCFCIHTLFVYWSFV